MTAVHFSAVAGLRPAALVLRSMAAAQRLGTWALPRAVGWAAVAPTVLTRPYLPRNRLQARRTAW